MLVLVRDDVQVRHVRERNETRTFASVPSSSIEFFFGERESSDERS